VARKLLALGAMLKPVRGSRSVRKVCHYPMFFALLGLVVSEKQIPQANENTEEVN
jgi:hypothetical protein